ncbi:uncharacterized protein LAJ45_03609 [Morchella importuna]|uniref:uncharacterized protein n=1 Tax=Morchella importuna TaxID=1174673 RepID=UPI001E8DCF35|nr:uncharacterized protein LAJ45_03609 [Morchella importuna]KAH8152183.1 hypothetical protein LAJ45_03609 [Morchella importuna]
MGLSVTERALNLKARVLLAELDKDVVFPPGWIRQWRQKHGIRTTDDISMPPPVVHRSAATPSTPDVSTVTAAASETHASPATAAASSRAAPATPLALSFANAPDLHSDVDESYRVYLDLIPEEHRKEKKPPIPGDRDLPLYLDD